MQVYFQWDIPHRLAVNPLLMKRMCSTDTLIHQIFHKQDRKNKKDQGVSLRTSCSRVKI